MASRARGGRSGEGFFARRVGWIVPREFADEVKRVERAVSSMTRSQLVELFTSMSTRSMRVEVAGPSRFVVRSEDLYLAARKGFVSPSMFVSYRSCARALAIEIGDAVEVGGIELTADDIRSLLKGIMVHRVYYDRFATGRTEVLVESPTRRIVGVVDELRVDGQAVDVVEVKSGWRTDVVGASLQVMSYAAAVSDVLGVPAESVRGYIVTPSGCYRVYLDEAVLGEYTRRLLKVVELALSGDRTRLPPRLPKDLRGRCRNCVLQRRCLSLPDSFGSYQRFFDAMGLQKLVPDSRRTLLDYSSGGGDEGGV